MNKEDIIEAFVLLECTEYDDGLLDYLIETTAPKIRLKLNKITIEATLTNIKLLEKENTKYND